MTIEIISVAILCLFVLLLIGLPMFAVLMSSAFVILFFYFPMTNLIVISQQMIDGIHIFSLLAVPLFIFAANIMSQGQAANKLVDFVMALIGNYPGGLAHTTICSCTLFGAISGSTQATVASIGPVMRPKLLKANYTDSFSMALIINASDISALIPPSIIMILYCITVNASVGELFLAGIGPGLIIAVFFMIYAYFWAKKRGISSEKDYNLKEIWIATSNAKWALFLPIIIIGGIYGGFFSPTEAAAVACLYAIVVEKFAYKSLTLKGLYQVALQTGEINAVIFLLIAGGQLFSWVLTYSEVPQVLVRGFISLDPSPMLFLFFVNALFFFGCMIINPTAAIVVLTPLVYPISTSLGIDPIHLGIIITLQVAIGTATPPFGIDIFTACAVFGKKYTEVIKDTPVFIGILLIVAIIITVWPSVALFSRNIFY